MLLFFLKLFSKLLICVAVKQNSVIIQKQKDIKNLLQIYCNCHFRSSETGNYLDTNVVVVSKKLCFSTLQKFRCFIMVPLNFFFTQLLYRLLLFFFFDTQL